MCYVILEVMSREFRRELLFHKRTDCKRQSSLFIQSDFQAFGHLSNVFSHSSESEEGFSPPLPCWRGRDVYKVSPALESLHTAP